MYDTWPTPPQAPVPKPKRGRGWLQFLGAAVLVILGVSTYVMLDRLSDDVLTVVATIGCAGALASPGVVLTIALLLRRAQHSGRQEREPRTEAGQPAMTQPMIMMVPPMALPPQQYPQVPGATWEAQPAARRFTIVGDENGLE